MRKEDEERCRKALQFRFTVLFITILVLVVALAIAGTIIMVSWCYGILHSIGTTPNLRF